VAAVVLAPLTTPARWSTLAVGGLAALAFVSHFGTFALLGVTLFAMAAWMAATGGPAWRDQARTLAATIAIGVVLATAGYYGHFWDVYVSQASRVMAESRRPAAESDRGDDVDQASSSSFGSDLESLDPEALAAARQRASERTKARRARPLTERLGGAMTQAAKPIGLPLLVLSVIGAAWVVAGKRRDAIVWALAGWATMCVVFILVGVFTPVRMRYFFAAVPAVAILAAAGTGWLWRAGLWGRAAAAGVFAWAGVTAAQAWLRWVTLP
jgi:hypothetical protein